jgi:hypothetical protein
VSDLLKLAERCEAAAGHDRELDVELAVVAGLIRDPEFERGYFYGAGNNCDYVLERGDYDHGNNAPELPYYTASLDAAKSLVDPRALWAIGSMEEGPFCRLCWPMPDGGFTGGYFEGQAETVPLSICSAALRARASMSHGEKQ